MKFEFLTDKEIIQKSKEKKISYTEDMLMKKMIKYFGEVATVQEVAEYFKISKSKVYKELEERKIVGVKIGNKILVVTITLVNLFTEIE